MKVVIVHVDIDVYGPASYSTSYSGSETSTDISMSSLENLSSSARQEPQGEETADLTSGLLDDGKLSASSSSLSSACGDDADAKSSLWQSSATTNDEWVATTSGQQLSHSQQQQQQPTQSSTAVNQSPNVVNYRPVVSAGAANSLIRQLLQTSPQYSHLLSDLEPMCTPATVEGKSTGSPKSALRSGGRVDGRCLPDTPTTSSSSSSPRSGQSKFSSSQTTAINRRLVNRYVNVDEDLGRSLQQQQQQQQQRGYRDRARPSTAPSEHPPPPTAASLPVTRVQTVADPVERHRSFEVVDRVTGATLPRPSTADKTDPQRKLSPVKRPSPPQDHQQSREQSLRTSPQHLQSSSSAQQQQQKVNGSAQCQQDRQTPPTTSSSSSSLCVEQQCSTGDNQRSSPQTVWYVRYQCYHYSSVVVKDFVVQRQGLVNWSVLPIYTRRDTSNGIQCTSHSHHVLCSLSISRFVLLCARHWQLNNVFTLY